MTLQKRSTSPELMDNEGNEDEVRKALNELRIINKLLGGNRVSALALNKVRNKFNLNHMSILDAGSGASDILTTGNLQKDLRITSLDKNIFICSVIKEKNIVENITCGNALMLPFKPGAFDVIHSSLFLHHFDEDEIIPLLVNMSLTARYAVIINDLQRSYIAYYGFKILSLLFSDNRLVRHDGTLSVLRAFKKKELVEILRSLKLRFEISWSWAFRWRIIIYTNETI